MPTKEDATNQVKNQQQVSITTESQFVNLKLHSRTKLHSGAKLQNEENAHLHSEISTHGRDAKTPNIDAHSDTKAERQSVRSRTEPKLSKYVRRHHLVDQIIRDKDARPMTRNRLRNETCLLSTKEPKIVRDALEDDEWYKAMEEEIQ